ncbi:MAG: glycosylase, partial [Acidothermaceae bacterium]
GHLSSLGFCTAVAGPGALWSFQPRALPVVAGTTAGAHWRREHLRAVLTDQGRVSGLAHSVLASLPDTFTGVQLERALVEAHHDLLARPGGAATVERLRRLVASAYEVRFPRDVTLSQQVLMPATAEESSGLEDARFVRFIGDDGVIEYRATYTAYDGRRIAPRLLTSPDLRSFGAHRLAGPAARNKGMALFPRLIGGLHWALCRSDGESNCLATSDDGFVWAKAALVQVPEAPWEVLQIGNCGSPIETDRGWLVLTHGVGPMRTYAIGAMLLDLDNPTRVLGRLERPLLQATEAERDGYVPNVVYSCGGLVHDGLLWLPYGIGDARIGVAWADLDELLDAIRS